VKRGIFLLLIFAAAQLLPAQEAGRGIRSRVQQLTGNADSVGRQYAVVIAIDRYRDWNALRNPVKDAQQIKEILSRRYYVDEFLELYDEEATKAAIIRLFEKLIGITKPQDSVFIFYAGHGHLDKLSDIGFWIPVDGGLDRYEQLNWLPNTQIRGFISKMKARHVLLVSDSCFSGDILNPARSISPEITDEYFRKAYARASRQVLTSGASESVPDQSPFARGLKMALDGNTSPYLDPLMLYGEIRLGVKGTTPLFGDLKDCGHQEGASFLLFLLEQQAPPVQPTFKLERSYGVLVVESMAAARLFLDEAFQGEVPVGARARLENVATGPHLVEVWFEDGGYESREVTVERGAETLVSFASEPEPEEPAEPEAPKPAEELKPLAYLSPLPAATIKIDGKLEDWQEVPPAFVDELTDRGGMDIERVFLAKDAEYLYMRIDIADQRPTTWLRPLRRQFRRLGEARTLVLLIQQG
jgi:hypothetical protein